MRFIATFCSLSLNASQLVIRAVVPSSLTAVQEGLRSLRSNHAFVHVGRMRASCHYLNLLLAPLLTNYRS